MIEGAFKEENKMNQLAKPDHLTVNLLAFAYGIDQTARFSWWNHADQQSMMQTAYRIVITRPDQQAIDHEFVLDTGWVKSSENTAVLIDNLNQSLTNGSLYHWQVQIKDNQNRTSELSAPAKFIYGQPELEKHGIWLSEFNTASDQLPNLGNLIFMRSPHFKVDVNRLDSAVISLIARGNEPVKMQACDLFVNGHEVGFGSARPQTHYRGSDKTAIFYNSYDVTAQVTSDNVIALAATGTKLANDNAADPNDNSQSQDDDHLRSVGLRLVLYYSDGNQQIINADENWRAFDVTNAMADNGQRIRSQYFGMPMDNVDMHYYPSKWYQNNFDDNHWSMAMKSPRSLIDPEREVLRPYSSENTRRFSDQFADAKVVQLGEGDWLVDLGKEIIGSLAVNLTSPVDQRVVVWTGEQLNHDHHVRHHLAAGPDYIESWSLLAGKNQFHTYQIKNFRYVELRGFKGILSVGDIQPWAIRQAFDENASAFHSDNELLNRQYKLSKYSIEATNQDVYVDSQARERRPYEGDLMVNANTSYVISSHYSLARYSMDWLFDNPTWPLDYRFFLLEAVWQDYLYTGDQRLLRRRYQDLKGKFYFGSQQDDYFDSQLGLVTGMGLVDWPIKERDGYIEGKYNTPFNAVYAGACGLMSKMAKVMGQAGDAEFFANRYQTIKSALKTCLYDEESGRYFDSLDENGNVNRHCSHHASAYALAYGMFDNQDMADRISDFVFNNGKFIGSIYFIYFMLKGLINTNHADKAVELLTNQDSTPNANTFAAIMDSLHATITPEAWSNAYKPNLTMSHPWGAAPGLTLIQGLMGIVPTKPGFEEFQINVRAGQLKHLQAKTPSAKGMISVKYDVNEDGTVDLQCHVPMGANAVVKLPSDIDKAMVNDQSQVVKEHAVMLNSGDWTLHY